ncbi:hypothetical protein, conserved [Eimeria praecox]|uniref:J domain-containing protein n=1 Tax=Eimeria praecox TaxID=51316 RepID=U6G6P1_9EIME|nr:hypothetical protein, conserved [Eimeria praecox]
MQRLLTSLLPPVSPFTLTRFLSPSFARFVSAYNKPNGECPFAVLGLPPDASADDLRLRYLQLAKQFHPDAARSEGDSRSREFIEVRRAYEKAVQLQRQKRRIDRPAEGPMIFWPPPEKQTNSAKEAMIRQEWERQQKERAAFWANAERARQQEGAGWGQAAAYQQEMLALFQSRVAAEQADSEKRKPENKRKASAEWEAAADDKAAAEAWEEYERELQAFGLKTDCSSYMGNGLYARKRKDLPRVCKWISREEKRHNWQKGRKYWQPITVTVGLVVGAAATVWFYNKEDELKMRAEGFGQ